MNSNIISKVLKKLSKSVKVVAKEGAENIKEAKTKFKNLKLKPAAEGISDDELAYVAKKISSPEKKDIADLKKIQSVFEEQATDQIKIQVGRNHNAIKSAWEKDKRVVSDIAQHIDEKAVAELHFDPNDFINNKLYDALNIKTNHSVYSSLRNDLKAKNVSLYGAQKYKEVVEVAENKAKSLVDRANVQRKYLTLGMVQKNEQVKMSGTAYEEMNRWSTTVYDKLNSLYSFARHHGNIPLADSITSGLKLMKFNEVSRKRISLMGKNIEEELGKYGDDGLLRIENYLRKADFYKKEPLTSFGGVNSAQMKSIDREVMKEFGLSEDMVRTANKYVQQKRNIMTYTDQLSKKNYDERGILSDANISGDLIPDNLLKDMSVPGKYGDLGANYFPLIPKESYKMKLDGFSRSEFELMENTAGGLSHKFSARRSWNSELSQNPELRLNLIEANEVYTRSALTNLSKGSEMDMMMGVANLDSTYGYLLRRNGKVSTLETMEQDLERTKSRLAPIFKQIKLKYEAPAKSRETLLGKAFWGAFDISATFAISSPTMAALNTLQPITTVTNIPFATLLKQYAKNAPRMAKDVILGVANFNNIQKQVSATGRKYKPDSTEAYVFERYMSKLGDINLATEIHNIDTSKTFNFVGKKVGKKISNFLTYLYKSSDLQARVVVLDASTDHFRKGMKKFGHLKNVDNIKFRSEMRKHLNLDNFYGKDIEIDDLMLSLTHRNEKETAYKFADLTTNTALFDYSAGAKPQFSQLAKKGDFYRAATMFSSWGLFYSNIAKSYAAAASQGNYKPLIGLAGAATVWGTTMSSMADSDNYFVRNFGAKGISRTPGLAAIMTPASMAKRSLGGMIVNPLEAMTAGFLTPMNAIQNKMTKNKDFLDYQINEMTKRKGPLLNYIDNAMETYRELK